MLVLSRKKGQSIIISNNVVVRIIDIKGGQVRIGITAPDSTSIYREEIYMKIVDTNRESLQLQPEDLELDHLNLPKPAN